MSKNFISLLLLALVSSWNSPALAENPLVVEQMSEKRGRIQFDHYRRSAGSLPRGSKVDLEFPFVNAGIGALRIFGVHGSCGCTAVEFEEGKIYSQGDRGVIKVRLDTTDFVGKLSKVITVLTNDRRQRVRLLTVTANIQETIVVDPPLVNFASRVAGSENRIVVKLKASKAADQFKVVRVLHSKAVATQLSEIPMGYQLEVQLADDLEVGLLREMIVVETTHDTMKKIKVPVMATVRSELLTEGDYLEFGAVKAGSVKTKVLPIPPGQPINYSAFKVAMYINGQKVEGDERLDLKVLEDGERRSIEISLKHLNAEDRGSVYGDIIFDSKDSLARGSRLPFYGFFSEDKG